MDDETGERIKQARVARGISQAELAASVGMSNSYLSHIEAGRRPVKDPIRLQIAAALGMDPQQLVDGVPADRKEELRLRLSFAEMALRNGGWELAQTSFQEALESARTMPLERFVDEAHWGLARSLEATGRLEEAIAAYEELLSKPALSGAVSGTSVRVALVRAYRECGDLGRAVDVGERGLTELESAPADELGPHVELISTLAGCYVERGDLTRAALLSRQALDLADQASSMQARAAAAWEAAAVAQSRHEVAAARRHADRALALYEELDSQRAVAMLRVVSAALFLRQDRPDPAKALPLLEQAFGDLSDAGNDVDLAYVRTEQARALLLSGRTEEAAETIGVALEALSEGDKLQRGRMLLLRGHVARAAGQADDALSSFQDAASHLRQAGAVRQAATAWRELGEAYAELGRPDDAIDAMRQSSDLLGVRLAPHSLAAVGNAVRK
ncbi:MAG TPA: tetratricopeptide repeat protein [Nocardioides sp.]|jgi:tetratricopeptide (TPR) repeat protein|uniref:helix-turn-helix domain-containing protein n=1 Tax=Nocardioides sp. TaxID=35761 RepID=UPI002E3024E2|nr:tetratricopeptide repeat protein [Nocardioides sp.]HEX3930413.1 tetratricopeptide repeat protein [Nocardioides sp.]